MTRPPGVGVYQALLRLYPRWFRDEYGPDMALLFADQLRDEAAARVWARGLVDLALTIPNRHLEAHMHRPPSPAVPLLFAMIGLAGLGVAVIGGSSQGMLAIGLPVAAVAAVLAGASWRQTRPLATTSLAAAHWWQFLAGGAGILAAVIAVTTATGEVGGSMWWPMLITVICGFLLVATGLILGVTHLSSGRPGNAPS